MQAILPTAGEAAPGEARPEPAVSRPPGTPLAHTQVHDLVRRTLENLQDIIVSLLIALLFFLSLRALWRLARKAVVEHAQPAELLSDVVFVLILIELYRLLIFYLREHRVSVALAIEVALVSVVREVILMGAQHFDTPRVVGLSVLLLVLGALLAAERWTGRWRNEVSELDAC
jgi:uncharacterized membrane protein (DUF373 family)